MKLGNCKSKAFTLVEFLMVLAIIALLTSIMMPTLHKAKSMAKRVTCLSNLRNIGIALEFYALDNEFRYPQWYSFLAGDPCLYWNFSQFLGGYKGRNPVYLDVPQPQQQSITSGPLLCPTQSRAGNWTSYGANAKRFNMVMWDRTFSPGTWLKKSILSAPSETVSIYCSGASKGGGYPGFMWGWDSRYDDFHGGYPILWFDGHATFEDESIVQSSRNW